MIFVETVRAPDRRPGPPPMLYWQQNGLWLPAFESWSGVLVPWHLGTRWREEQQALTCSWTFGPYSGVMLTVTWDPE